ncbi:MAG: helix-turn-helix domain-containing protein [Clostridia bacterium]|nr:helix-turn-helix domain-containing protein [Clostridia bacterium]
MARQENGMPVDVSAPNAHVPNEGPKAIWISDVASPLCKFAHKASTQANGTYAMHSHPFYEMIYTISADVEFMIEDHPYRVGDHTLVAIPPRIRHGVLVNTDRTYERFTLHFDEACLSVERRVLLQEVLPKHLFDTDQSRGEACIWRNMDHSGLLQCLEAMETLHLANTETAGMLLPIYVESVLATLYTAQQTQGRPAAHSPHANTIQQELVLWVEQHYTESFTLESLAERFYLSRGYVNTLFQQATGTTVKAYVQKRRMSYVQMLLSAGLSAAQAANRAGFEDYTTFYRAYVRTYGHPPPLPKRPLGGRRCWRKR